MAALVGISTNLAAILTAHVALELVNRCGFRPTNNIQSNGLMCTAAEAFDLEIPITGIQGVTECRRWLSRPMEGKHSLIPSLTGQPVGFAPRLRSLLSCGADGSTVDGLS